jgi:NitT/TauT family transport system permease protein
MRRVRPVLLGIAGIVVLALLWEGYKAVGPAQGVIVGHLTVLPRTSDLAMPHLITMFARLGQPVISSAGSPPLWLAVVRAAGFTLGISAVGWIVGVVVGFLLAMLMQRLRTAESALLPWIVLSQTVPLIALAPLVAGIGNQIRFGEGRWQEWMSVAVIASYLAFFPVSIGALRGFESPDQAHIELMHAYSVGWWKTFVHLRLPASVPYLLSALRLAAASAVVGTVVAEISIGLSGGVGRMMIEYASASSGDPGKPWAPIFGAIAVGLIAAAVVALLGLALKRYRRGEVSA